MEIDYKMDINNVTNTNNLENANQITEMDDINNITNVNNTQYINNMIELNNSLQTKRNTDITFQISAKTYWGYKINISRTELEIIPTHFERVQYVINMLKTSMESFFLFHNLQELYEGVKKLHLCMHDVTDILNYDFGLNKEPIIYVCDHS